MTKKNSNPLMDPTPSAVAKAQDDTQVTQLTETLEQKIARLERENAELKSRPSSSGGRKAGTYATSVKLAAKADKVSVYGLGRFPINFYAPQFREVCLQIPTIMETFVVNRETILKNVPEHHQDRTADAIDWMEQSLKDHDTGDMPK